MYAKDRAVRIVEQTNAQTQSIEEVAQQIAKEHTLAPAQEETLKKEVEVIKEMDENIRRFNDQEVMIRDQIVALSQRYFSNPRDIKRFLNVFRFYFFLRAARQARGESVQSLEQMSRHIVLSLKWPEVVRWMRRSPPISGTKAKSAIAALEDIGGQSQNAHQWQKHVESELGGDSDEGDRGSGLMVISVPGSM